MNTIPVVSVVMITFGHEKYIEKAINSVLMQKCNFEIELIISNDYSADNTDSVVNNILSNHIEANSIRYFKKDKNIGMMANFEFALNEAKGKYIALCEGDDYWTDSLKLQKQVDFLEKNDDFALVFHDVDLVDENSKIIQEGYVKNKERIRSSHQMVSGSHIPTCTVLFRNCIDEFPKNFSKVKNGDSFLFAILGHYGKAYFMTEIKNTAYRVHSGGVWSLSSDIDKKTNQYESFCEIKKFSNKKFYASLNLKLASSCKSLFKINRAPFKKIYFLASTVKYLTFNFLNKFFKIYI